MILTFLICLTLSLAVYRPLCPRSSGLCPGLQQAQLQTERSVARPQRPERLRRRPELGQLWQRLWRQLRRRRPIRQQPRKLPIRLRRVRWTADCPRPDCSRLLGPRRPIRIRPG